LNQSTLGVDWIYLNQHIIKVPYANRAHTLVLVQNIISNDENENEHEDEKDYDTREPYASSSSKLSSLMFMKQM
jgi:hypothetical protein